MKLIGMMCVRNEDWCLGLSLRVALMWCDEVVVLLHACTDRSSQIVNEICVENPGRVIVRTHRHETWKEMAHRQHMLEIARGMGATHLAIIDADEVLTGNIVERVPLYIRNCISSVGPGNILELPGYNLRDPFAAGQSGPWYHAAGAYGASIRAKNMGLHSYHNNGVWGNRWFSTAFADAPDLGWSGDRFHHREPGPRKLHPYQPIQQGHGGVMHLWGASERRLIAKHALYKVTERLRWPQKPRWIIDNEYSLAVYGSATAPLTYGTPTTWTYSPVPESWWAPYAHLMKYLDVDAEPWQEAEVRRLVAIHGRDKFAGLDLFGVA